ncbi:hypothetical protein N7452_007184, partial [Penicillium brevicompactum]
AFLLSSSLDTKTLSRLPNPKTHSGFLNSIETMAQAELDRLSIGTESGNSDLEDGDTVIARGWARNMANLKTHGFRPAWTSSNGYPDADIPSDIMEYLDENGLCGAARCIGPLKSLAWLAVLDELVEAIDNSAFTVEDSIEIVPSGAGLMWPIEYLIEQGRISSRIADRVFSDSSGAKLFDH